MAQSRRPAEATEAPKGRKLRARGAEERPSTGCTPPAKGKGKKTADSSDDDNGHDASRAKPRDLASMMEQARGGTSSSNASGSAYGSSSAGTLLSLHAQTSTELGELRSQLLSLRQEVLTLETNLENKEAIIATMQGNAAEFGGVRERLATALADAARQSALASEKDTRIQLLQAEVQQQKAVIYSLVKVDHSAFQSFMPPPAPPAPPPPAPPPAPAQP